MLSHDTMVVAGNMQYNVGKQKLENNKCKLKIMNFCISTYNCMLLFIEYDIDLTLSV